MAEAEQDHPFADWMRDETAACAELNPFQFCFPGAHDSASYRLTGDPVQLPDGATWKAARVNGTLNALVKCACLRKLVGRWTITHPGQTIYSQLMGGIRFLDMRISKSDKNQKGESAETYILVHTFGVGYLEEALADLLHFVADHPGELVLFACVPVQAGMDQAALQHYIESYLGKHACPADTLLPSDPVAVPSIKAITDAGHNVILLGNPSACSTDGSESAGPLVWIRKEKLTSGPGAFQSLINVNRKTALNRSMLAAYLDSTPTSQQSTDLFQLAHTVTPTASSVVGDLFRCRSLVDHANVMNDALADFVASALGERERRAVNIITVDNQRRSAVVAVARQLVRDRLATVGAAPESEAPESEAPESEAPESEAPESEAPESEAPESEAPESEAPESEAPESEGS